VYEVCCDPDGVLVLFFGVGAGVAGTGFAGTGVGVSVFGAGSGVSVFGAGSGVSASGASPRVPFGGVGAASAKAKIIDSEKIMRVVRRSTCVDMSTF